MERNFYFVTLTNGVSKIVQSDNMTGLAVDLDNWADTVMEDHDIDGPSQWWVAYETYFSEREFQYFLSLKEDWIPGIQRTIINGIDWSADDWLDDKLGQGHCPQCYRNPDEQLGDWCDLCPLRPV